MKWVGISGSWRKTNSDVEQAVREKVAEIISNGDGIVTGGALNVDYFATEEALKFDPLANQIKVFLPSTLEIYVQHYRKRAQEGVITPDQAEKLIALLTQLKEANRDAIMENKTNQLIDKEAYYERNTDVVNNSDELLAFQVNGSEGVQDTVDKARQKGIPVKVFSYEID